MVFRSTNALTSGGSAASSSRCLPDDDPSEETPSPIRWHTFWSASRIGGALPCTTPAAVERLVRRCLRKDPERRLRDIGDAVEDLEETHGTDGVVHTTRAPAARRPSRWLWLVGRRADCRRVRRTVVVVVDTAADARRQPVMQLPLDLGSDVSLGDKRFGPAAAISPDGGRLDLRVQQPPDDTASRSRHVRASCGYRGSVYRRMG